MSPTLRSKDGSPVIGSKEKPIRKDEMTSKNFSRNFLCLGLSVSKTDLPKLQTNSAKRTGSIDINKEGVIVLRDLRLMKEMMYEI
jgi:hypothetical protein